MICCTCVRRWENANLTLGASVATQDPHILMADDYSFRITAITWKLKEVMSGALS